MTFSDLRLARGVTYPGGTLPLRLTVVVVGIVMTSTGSLIAANQLVAGDWGELVQVPLITAMVCAMIWHARRRERAIGAYERKSRQLELVTSVTAAANEAATIDDLLRVALAELCELGGWPVGQVWTPSDEHGGKLVATALWHCDDPERFAALRTASLETMLGYGDGLPGRALATRSSQWSADEHLSRGGAAEVASAFAIPVTTDQTTVAVVEFFSLDPNPPEPDLMDLLSHIGDQLGHVAQRTRSESKLRAAEERYRSLVETLPLATYVDAADQVAGVGWVSPQIGAITSYPSDEWLADPELFSRVLHPDDRERVFAEIERAKAAGEPLEHEYRFVRRDGTVVWVRDSAVILTNDDGSRYARGFVVDVTARREAELERDEMLAREQEQNVNLRALDRMKDEFVALVSHELRTPLTSIRGYIELLGEHELEPEQRVFLETIDRNADRLQRVVGDLLFCAQVEAGTLSLEQGSVDLNAIARDSVASAQPLAAPKGIALTLATADLPELAGDGARLAQVLDNFVSNAVKFTPPGGRVSIRTATTERGVAFEVSDTGMGISEAELPKLFQRFFRTREANAQAIPGTGLGLAIAHAIVEGHGGVVTVRSTVGTGTTFRVELPLAAVAVAAVA